MISRIRPFFHNSYIDSINQFDGSIDREQYHKNISNKVKKYYPDAKTLNFINHGRNSLSIFLKLLNLKKNDEILIPCFSCSSILESFISTEIKPVLYDINYDFTIDIDHIQKKITQQTKAIVITHYFGIPSNIIEIKEITDAYGIYIVEDCAHTLCFKNKNNKTLGSIGDMSFTSFKNDKPLSIGNGSILIINNNELSNKFNDFLPKIPLNEIQNEKCAFLSLLFFYLMTERSFYNQFLEADEFYNYFITHRSKTDLIFHELLNKDIDMLDLCRYLPNFYFNKYLFNIRRIMNYCENNIKNQNLKPLPKLMDTFSLKILNTALDHIDEINSIRTVNGSYYNTCLLNNEVFFNPNQYQNVPFLRYSIICKQPALTRQIIKKLNLHGFECGNFNWRTPLNKILKISGKYENSEYITKNIINLPCHTGVNKKDIFDICDILNGKAKKSN